MSTIKKKDFERIERGEIIKVRNRIFFHKKRKKIFQTQISKGRSKAK